MTLAAFSKKSSGIESSISKSIVEVSWCRAVEFLLLFALRSRIFTIGQLAKHCCWAAPLSCLYRKSEQSQSRSATRWLLWRRFTALYSRQSGTVRVISFSLAFLRWTIGILKRQNVLKRGKLKNKFQFIFSKSISCLSRGTPLPEPLTAVLPLDPAGALPLDPMTDHNKKMFNVFIKNHG